jgi:archaellum component FlaF (FlaF/FlaG flagellin family)
MLSLICVAEYINKIQILLNGDYIVVNERDKLFIEMDSYKTGFLIVK